ncbi:hypothetical protein MKX01_009799, partial [Papaver californicum]
NCQNVDASDKQFVNCVTQEEREVWKSGFLQFESYLNSTMSLVVYNTELVK